MHIPDRSPTPAEEDQALRTLLGNGAARTLRELAGLTTEQLAIRIGVNPRSLRAWEEGRAYPRQRYAVHKYVAVLRELCQAPAPALPEDPPAVDETPGGP